MPPFEHHSEAELLLSLKAKDQHAFSYLYDNYSAALYGIVIKVLGREEVAHDVLQEVFVKIWQKIDHYDSQKGKLYTWMLHIARNTAIDTLRSSAFQKARSTLEFEKNALSDKSSFSTVTPVEHLGLKKIVQQLKDKYKEIIDLAYFKGYTQEEIAAELEIPVGTVKTRSRNALIELKNIMK